MAMATGDGALLRRVRQCREKDGQVAEALAKLQKLGPRTLRKGIEEWNAEDGLTLFRGRVYVPKDVSVRRDIVKLHHDSLAAGHPGRWKTLELVSRNYWWPGMSKFVHDYVDGCDTCARTKTFPKRPTGPLKPNEVPDAPWQTISVDFITDLPLDAGKDAILMVTDHHTHGVHIIATEKTADTDELCRLYLQNVWKLHGTPRKIISDRGPQFASNLMRAVNEALGIETALSTAFHPQTDGQTERLNQEIEQYLRTFVSWRQDDWVRYLPMAEFALNSREHSATRQSPFFMTYGYHPEFHMPLNPVTTSPTAKDRLNELHHVREDAQAALRLAKETMKIYYDRHVGDTLSFEKGELVWLDAANVKLKQPSRKLSHKRLGPFAVVEKIGEWNYRLKLPKSMKVHPVFHVSLLTQKLPDLIPGRHRPPPPPIEVEGEEEYEVEEILDSRMHYGKLQYFVKWKGYTTEENSWEPAENVANALDAVANFHVAHPNRPKRIAADIFNSLNWRTRPQTFTKNKPRRWESGIMREKESRS